MANILVRLDYTTSTGGGGGIVEYANLAAFPPIGNPSLIYLALDTKKIYKWTSGAYLLISPSEVTSVNTEVGAVVLDKTDIGLGNVDNTSDANKPISTATQAALDLITDVNWTGDYNNGVTYTVGDGVMFNGASFRMIIAIGAAGYNPVAYPANWLQVTDYVSPNDIGLGNVDNTSDVNKPISSATQTALNAKEDSSNKSTSTALGTSDTLYPTQNAVKTYVDTTVNKFRAEFVFQPGGTAGGNVYTSWALLHTQLAATAGNKIVFFDDRFSSPCVIPSGDYNFTNTVLSANIYSDTGAYVIVSAGVEFIGLGEVNNILLEFQTNSTVQSFFDENTINFRNCVIKSSGTLAPFEAEGASLIVNLQENAVFQNNGAPVFKQTSGGDIAFNVYSNSSIGSNTVSSVVGSSILFNIVDPSAVVSQTQIGILGTTSYINKSESSKVNYPPTTPANWSTVPTTVLSGLDVLASSKVNTSSVGAINGVASLDGSGKVPSTQLPSYVDDVLEFADLAAFPVTGQSGIIYLALDTNKIYRWSGSAYIEISQGITDHTLLSNIGTNTHANIDTHIAGTSGVHGVTGSVVGTSDSQALTNKTIDADLNTISNIENADIKAAAAIDRTKLASGTADHVVINSAAGVMSSEAALAASRGGLGTSGAAFTGVVKAAAGVFSAATVVNTDVSATAAIDRTKLASGTANRIVVNDGTGVMADAAAITASRALVSDTNGIPTASAVTSTELGYVSGVTSAIQTQIDAKQNTITGAATTITTANLTASRAVVSDASGKIDVSAATSTEVGYLSGVTSAIQTQINAKQNSLGFTPEDVANKSTNTSLGTSDTLYSTQNAVKSYVDTQITNNATPDATTLVKGKVKLAGDLAGTADLPTVPGLATKEPSITAGTTSQYWRGDKTFQTLDKSAVGLSNVDNTSDANKPISTATQTALNAKQDSLGFTPEDVANKSTTTSLGTSDTLYPTQNAVKTYVDNAVTGGATPDATTLVKGKVKLAGDLAGTADLPTVPGLATKEPTITATTSADYYRGDKTFQTLNKAAVGLSNVDNTSDADKPVSSATQTALNAKENSITAGTTGQYWRGDKSFQTLDKTAVGLSNVDNTSDADKPISSATQTALNAKENTITAGTTSQYYRGDKTFQTLDKSAVGLSNVDNTSDANKPISSATQTALNAKVETSLVGAINGVASLDGTGKVPSTQLPSYVDDVVEYANLAAFPVTGETSKIYIALDTNKCYRWSGSAYIEISPSEVNSVAGKTGIVTLVKADVGLSNVDNTSDADKPVSSATQTALNGKANTAHVHALSDLTQSSATSGQVPSWNGTNWVPVTPSTGVTDHTLLTNIGTNTHAQIDTFMANTANVYAESKEPTGFFSRATSTLSFDNGTRNFSITPTGSTFEFWVKGVKYTKTGAQTIQIPALSGNHFIYFDATGTLGTTQVSSSDLFIDNALISIIYWNTDTNTRTYFAEERHGMQMDGATHSYLHTVFGAQFISGLALQGFSVNGNGSLDAHAQFTSDSGTIKDEDITITISAQTQIPVLYRQGLLWRKKTADAFPFIYSGTAGYTGAAGRIPYNEFTGGAWQLTQIANNDFALVHLFATNDIENPVVAIQGIATYGNVSAARLAASSEITSLSGLPFAEFVALGSVVLESSNSYTNTPQAVVRSVNGGDYVDFRGTQLYTPAGEPTTHGLLSGLSSDDHLQYHTDARGDIRYYTKAEVDAIIAGITSPGDLDDTAFSFANNQSSAANVTGFAFANATVRSFKAHVSVSIDATTDLFEVFEIEGIQKGSEWDYSVSSVGDITGLRFSVTNAGQIQYTSTNVSGFVSGVVKFRAYTTSR